MKRSLAFLGAIVLTAGAAAAQPPVFPELPDNVELLRLENGLQVVLLPNPAQPMVGAYVVVGVGSAREDLATSGMSHMLEHLLFNGTQELTQEELYAQADRVGAYNNAHTTDFYTGYMMVLPAAELDTGLRLQSQMLLASTLPADRFEKERGIVLGELVAARDDPAHAAEEELRRALFAGTSLELPTLGTRATIASLDRDDTYAFYKRWYVPNNMILILAGNFDRDGALALVEKYYGAVEPRPLDSEPYASPPPLDRSRSVTRRAGRERTLALAFAAPEYGSSDYFAFLVATDLLEADGSGILTRAVDRLEPAVRPRVATWWQAAPGFGRLVIEFTLPDGFPPEEGYALMQDAVTAALKGGVTAADVREVVRMRETSLLQDREQLRMTGIVIAEALQLGGVDFFATTLPRLRAVTADEVTGVLRRVFVDRPCEAVLLEPEVAGEEPAAGPPLAGMPPGMKMPPAMAQAMAARDETTAEVAAADPAYRLPQGGASVVPVDRSVLASGCVLISQTIPGSDLMAIHLTARGRARLDREAGAPGAVNLVHRLLTSGVKGCDGVCLARRLRELGAVVKLVDDPRFPMDDYYTSGRFSFVRVECPAASGPQVLALLGELTQRASFTAEDVEREKQAQLAILAGKQGSAGAEAARLLRDALYGEHPLALPPEGTAAGVGSLTWELVRDVYQRAFAPDNLVWAVVSSLPHDDLATALARALPAGDGAPTADLSPLPITGAASRTGATLGGEMAAVRLGAVRTVDPADTAALDLLVAVLSDRIQMDLRETRGLSYSTGASVDVEGRELVFQAWLNPPLERVGEGEQSLRAAVETFDAASVTQEELDRIRGARQGRVMMRHLSSIGRAYYLAMAELTDDLTGYENAVRGYDAVSLADLTRVAAAYLADLPLVTVVVD